MRLLKQSSTAQPLMFLMIDSTAHIAGKTGLTPTVTLSKNGGSFGSPAGSVTELANGWYAVAGNATDTNTLGPLLLHATGTGADPVDIEFAVVAFDPQESVRLGLTALPNAAAEAAGGLFTRGTGAGQINQEANGYISVNLKAILGTVLTETAGLIAAGFKKFFNVASPTGTQNSLPDAVPGAAGGVFIAGTNAATVVTTSFTTTFTGNLTGNVGGNVTGSVGSIGTGGITSSSFASAAITADAIATDAVGALELAAGAASEIATAVRTELGTELGRIDAAVSSRMATFTYTTPPTVGAIRAEMDSNSTQLAAIALVTTHLATAMELDGSVYRFTTNALEQAPSGSGGTSLTISPLSATLSNDALTSYALTCGQYAGKSWTLAVYDSTGAAVSLSGKTVKVALWRESAPTTIVVSLTGTVGGSSNNNVTFAITGTNTATAEVYHFTMRNTTDDTDLLEGTLTVMAAPDIA